jgi:hypothetical protein
MRDELSIPNNENESSNWWLKLTAPKGAGTYSQAFNRQTREHLRRSSLTSAVAPFVFFAPLLLLQQSANIGTMAGIVVLMFVSILALFFNRNGKQVIAALLLVLAMDAVIEGALITASGGLGSGWLLTFDLFVIPLVTVGVLLNRRFLWFFIVFHITCILGDFYFLPHAPDLIALINQWNGPAVAFARPLIIQLGGGLLCWLAVRSTDEAIERADRAELIAGLQASIAEEKKQLEGGIQELLTVLTNAANGHYIQATLTQGNALWRISAAINALFARLQSSKQTEHQTQALLKQIQTVSEMLRMAQEGQSVRWPAPSNGPLEPLLRTLRILYPSSPPQTTQRFW